MIGGLPEHFHQQSWAVAKADTVIDQADKFVFQTPPGQILTAFLTHSSSEETRVSAHIELRVSTLSSAVVLSPIPYLLRGSRL